MPSIGSLAELSKNERFANRVHLGVREFRAEGPDVVAELFGLTLLGEDWRSIDGGVAYSVLLKLLTEDMAYNQRRLSDAQANALASEFLGHFGADARFYTNGTWEIVPDYVSKGTGAGHSWIPATSATFDGGVLAVDDERCGVLWIEDED